MASQDLSALTLRAILFEIKGAYEYLEDSDRAYECIRKHGFDPLTAYLDELHRRAVLHRDTDLSESLYVESIVTSTTELIEKLRDSFAHSVMCAARGALCSDINDIGRLLDDTIFNLEGMIDELNQ